MGYTHYTRQSRDFTKETWAEVCTDIGAILRDVQHVQNIPLANGNGERGTQPEVTPDKIWINGVQPDDDHETFSVYRKRPPLEAWQRPKDRGRDSCKTARKPYDLAVTAALCYLASIHGFHVTSDGNAHEWLDGLQCARRALPRYANQLDIPLPILKDSRWDWVARYEIGTNHVKSERYEVLPCIDGAVYVFETRNERNAYRFPSREEAKAYFAQIREERIFVVSQWGRNFNAGQFGSWEGGQPLFATSGSFDKRRTERLRRTQDRVIRELLQRAETEGRRIAPPAYARPRAIPGVEREQASLSDLFDLAA